MDISGRQGNLSASHALLQTLNARAVRQFFSKVLFRKLQEHADVFNPLSVNCCRAD